MNALFIVAGCVFCDVSAVAIAWIVLVMVFGFVGIVLTIFELLHYIKNKRNKPSESAPFISVAHALMLGTLASYTYFLSFTDLAGYETLPAVVAFIASVLIFIIMLLLKHAPKVHLITIALLIVSSSLIYVIQGDADWALVALWSLMLVLVSAVTYLVKSRK